MKEENTQEYNMTFEARDPRVIDTEVNNFRDEMREEGGEVFHIQANVNMDLNVLAKIIKGEKLDKNETGLIYTYTAMCRLPVTDATKKADRVIDQMVTPHKRHEMRIKVENKDNKKWVECVHCHQRWGWNYFSHCRCGSNEPPAEVRKEYDAIWGK